MAKVILLGTGAALSDAVRENTYLVVQGDETCILVDCAGSPTQRLLRAGIPLDRLDHLILTHHHPDHIYGLSVLLLDLWLTGRKKTLHVYGLAETLHAARAMMHAFEWERWREHGFFPVEFHRVSKRVCAKIIATPEFTVSTAPTVHLLPCIGVRFDSVASGKSITYSSDTTMCDSVVALACDSNTLIHESTSVDEPLFGHSSARQAGEQATRARVKKLVLIHLSPTDDPALLRAAAQSTFHGSVVLAKDFMRLKF